MWEMLARKVPFAELGRENMGLFQVRGHGPVPGERLQADIDINPILLSPGVSPLFTCDT
jgi:hypothetical protein